MDEQTTFSGLGLSEPILRALEQNGYGYPTSIQAQAIPPFLAWQDVIAKAPTGTGKTFAFGIPMLEHIDADSDTLQGLILAPTRELALQIGDELRTLTAFLTGVRIAVVYGGSSMDKQVRQLQKKPQLVVATPGRLMDHYRRRNLQLDKVLTCVLDEADRMLDMGFFKDVTGILDKLTGRRNLGLFSATISQEVMTVSWMYQRDETEITVPADQDNRPDIDQFCLSASGAAKVESVLHLICVGGYDRVILFCNTKTRCQSVCSDLRRQNIAVDCIHGDIRQDRREKAMRAFRDGQLRVLVATDIASRGIDVDNVDCVINYDIPEENEYYLHRIGRTGRAGKKGVAYSLIGSFAEKAKLDEIAKYCRYTITPMKFNADGCLVRETMKTPVIKKKYR